MSLIQQRLQTIIFAMTLFLSACLAFWVQPLLAKMILPYLGGSPSVWNTCVMFFQGVLLAGYLYAHYLIRIPVKAQPVVHIAILSLGIIFIPFVIDPNLIPSVETPIFSVVKLLVFTSAVPLIALSASAPLLQRWFSNTAHVHADDPYFLYTASSAGSIAGLIIFPFFLEPHFTLSFQNHLWTVSFVCFFILVIICGSVNYLKAPEITEKSDSILSGDVTWKRRLYWLALTFAPSSLLLGLTTYITTDIASVPLFWVVPLVLYMMTFIFAFAKRQIISESTAQIVQLALIIPIFLIMSYPMHVFPHSVKLIIHLSMLFFTALVCHLELVKYRPHHERLTDFYFFVALGGFLGGVFNTLIAPLLFVDIYEYPAVLLFAILLVPSRLVPKKYLASGLTLLLVTHFYLEHPFFKNSIYTTRNFFGTTRVVKMKKDVHFLLHGTTTHGLQIREPGRETFVASYYRPLVSIFDNLRSQKNNLNVGITGLGTGSCACLAKGNDMITFFEINPDIINIASNPNFFSFLELCPPQGGIYVGDARLKMKKISNNSYDIMILDAFSSDSIPVHLLTAEAMQLYFSKLKNDGILLVNISNRFLDLKKVVSALAKNQSLQAKFLVSKPDDKNHVYRATWAILAKPNVDLKAITNGQDWTPAPPTSNAHLWTDDYSNIVREFR